MTSSDWPETVAMPTASPCALKTATFEMVPKMAGSKFITSRPPATSCGVADEILICAQPPGGAVSLDICKARSAAGSVPARRSSCIGTTQAQGRPDWRFSMMRLTTGKMGTRRAESRPGCARMDKAEPYPTNFAKREPARTMV